MEMQLMRADSNYCGASKWGAPNWVGSPRNIVEHYAHVVVLVRFLQGFLVLWVAVQPVLT